MTAAIVGWAHTPFGKLNGETVESLIVRVTTEALADAGIEAKDVDEIVLGHFNAGFSAQDFTASLVLQASPDLRFKRALRVENACATGSAAVHQGIKSIEARAARIVLAVGVEQMTTTPPAEIGRNLLKASYVREEAEIEGGFAGVFGTNVFSAQGAGTAVVNAGLGGHVQVVAYDATKAAIELMNNGVVTLVLAQKPFDMGYLGVLFAQADAAGVTSLPRRVQTGFAIIDKQNVKDPAVARFIYQVPG